MSIVPLLNRRKLFSDGDCTGTAKPYTQVQYGVTFTHTMNTRGVNGLLLALIVGVLPVSGAEAPPPSAAEVEALQQRLAQAEEAIRDLQDGPAREAGGLRFPGSERLLISGQGGVAWFENQHPDGSPDSGFRVDEALLFLEAQLHSQAFLFTEIKFLERESQDESTELGELYVDVEDPLPLGGAAGLLSVRAGRFDTPFGEEYLTRDASLNPLISHSLADIWGVDEGVALYGRAGSCDYIMAVQNAGVPVVKEGDDDKAIIGRLGYEPCKTVRLSVSALRTGDLDAAEDEKSELWFGNGFFVRIGAPETTTKFHVDMIEGDARWRWRGGHVAGALGYLEYDDNDTAADNRCEAVYYSVEVVQTVRGGLYGATRFSQIQARDGFPIIGQADYPRLLAPPWVEDIWRLSTGLGYRWSPNLILKAEYSVEQGDDTEGQDLEDADLASVELAFRF